MGATHSFGESCWQQGGGSWQGAHLAGRGCACAQHLQPATAGGSLSATLRPVPIGTISCKLDILGACRCTVHHPKDPTQSEKMRTKLF
jgi:hypothetical protein